MLFLDYYSGHFVRSKSLGIANTLYGGPDASFPRVDASFLNTGHFIKVGLTADLEATDEIIM